MSAILGLFGASGTAGGLSFFMKNVPKLKDNLPLIVFILNIFLPGIGTLVAAFYCEDDDVLTFNGVSALLQFITAFILIGWIWSIFWGYLLLCVCFAQNKNRIKKVRRFQESEIYDDIIRAEDDEFVDDIQVDESEVRDDSDQDVEYENCIEYQGGHKETYTPRPKDKDDKKTDSKDESPSSSSASDQKLSFNPYQYYKSLLDQDLNYVKYYGDKVNTHDTDSQYSQIAKKYANNLANHAKYLYKYRTFAPSTYRKYILQVYEYSKRVVEVAKVQNWNGYLYYLSITIEYYRKIDVLEQTGYAGTNYVQTAPVATYYGAGGTPTAYYSNNGATTLPPGSVTATAVTNNPGYYYPAAPQATGYGYAPAPVNNYQYYPNNYGYRYPASSTASYYPANYNYGYPVTTGSYYPPAQYQQPAVVAAKAADQQPSQAAPSQVSSSSSPSGSTASSSTSGNSSSSGVQTKKINPMIEKLEQLNSQVSSHVGEFNDDASNPISEPFTFEYLM